MCHVSSYQRQVPDTWGLNRNPGSIEYASPARSEIGDLGAWKGDPWTFFGFAFFFLCTIYHQQFIKSLGYRKAFLRVPVERNRLSTTSDSCRLLGDLFNLDLNQSERRPTHAEYASHAISSLLSSFFSQPEPFSKSVQATRWPTRLALCCFNLRKLRLQSSPYSIRSSVLDLNNLKTNFSSVG